jgi:hypothetical protein
MAVADLLSYIYGLNPGNAQQAVNDTYRNQMTQDYLNTNLSSGMTQLQNPQDLNFRQALFYDNFLKSEEERKRLEAADAAAGADDTSVRGWQDSAPKPAAADPMGNMRYVRVPAVLTGLNNQGGNPTGYQIFPINAKYADQFSTYLIDPNNPAPKPTRGYMGNLTAGQAGKLKSGEYLY